MWWRREQAPALRCFIEDMWIKNTPLSLINKRQRRNYLCGTTLIPSFNGTRTRNIGRNPVQPTFLSVYSSEGIPFVSVYCLAPTGSSLKTACPKGLVLVIACNYLENLVIPTKRSAWRDPSPFAAGRMDPSTSLRSAQDDSICISGWDRTWGRTADR